MCCKRNQQTSSRSSTIPPVPEVMPEEYFRASDSHLAPILFVSVHKILRLRNWGKNRYLIDKRGCKSKIRKRNSTLNQFKFKDINHMLKYHWATGTSEISITAQVFMHLCSKYRTTELVKTLERNVINSEEATNTAPRGMHAGTIIRVRITKNENPVLDKWSTWGFITSWTVDSAKFSGGPGSRMALLNTSWIIKTNPVQEQAKLTSKNSFESPLDTPELYTFSRNCI